jgi:uracil-DNA glycosylase
MDNRKSKLKEVEKELLACRKCADEGFEIYPPALLGGTDEPNILVIGQAPSKKAAQVGLAFRSQGGRLFFQWINRAGWTEEEFRRSAYLSGLTRCYPGRSAKGKGDRVPSKREIELCRSYRERVTEIIDTKVVMLIGKMAITEVLGPHKLDDIIGTVIVQDDINYVPFPHPSGVNTWVNYPENKAKIDQAVEHLARLKKEYGL